ncbi:hypothetical protein ACQ4PT_034968 [Festuca glaucescens]
MDSIIGVVPKSFQICKVLTRSTPDDVIVLMPNNLNYPIILVRPGKGVWVPKPKTSPFTRIIDVAFLGDILYGITQAEDLFVLDIDFDADGVPMVTGTRRVIKSSTEVDDSDVWSNYEWVDDGDEGYNESNTGKEDDDNYSHDDNYDYDDDGTDDNDDDDDDDSDDDNEILDAIDYAKDDEVPMIPKDIIISVWYLVESRGKLLMVRRKVQGPPRELPHTRKIEVFEADISACTWAPVANGLGGHTVFISKPFSKSVPAVRESEDDAIHFIDTRDTFNMRFDITIRPHYDVDYLKLASRFFLEQRTWLFPLVPAV